MAMISQATIVIIAPRREEDASVRRCKRRVIMRNTPSLLAYKTGKYALHYCNSRSCASYRADEAKTN